MIEALVREARVETPCGNSCVLEWCEASKVESSEVRAVVRVGRVPRGRVDTRFRVHVAPPLGVDCHGVGAEGAHLLLATYSCIGRRRQYETEGGYDRMTQTS